MSILRVSDLMTPDPHTVEPDTPLHEVLRHMNTAGERQYPVMQDGRLVGIVSDRDVRLAVGSPVLPGHDPDARAEALDRLRVEDCMSGEVVTVEADAPAADAARLLSLYKFGALPVVDAQQRLVGIIATVDFLDHFAEQEGV